MNIKQWIALLMVYVGYLLIGALVFYSLERDQEMTKRSSDFQLYKDIVGILNEVGINRTTVLSLEGYCGRPLTENADIDEVSQEYWSFYKSVVFVLTVVSTVGYGNIHPTMPLTRYLMILYGLIGLPINAILLTSLASFFSSVFIRAHKKYKRYESRFGLAVDILTYLIPGILVFIFLPATAFYFFEGWTYEESIYFAFVTLTTIGFGDYVAGQKNYKGFSQEAVAIYKILLLGWIIFGLGYLIMLLGYLTRAMRSKKVVKLEQKLVEALTHSKIWHGFTKDLGYLRRIMNELYLDKFKPVFHDEQLKHHRRQTYKRSKSLPNVVYDGDNVNEEKRIFRKRAQSEYAPNKEGLVRVFSENDLHRIDKKATFASAAAIQPSELLRQVVGAMEGSMMWNPEHSSMGINVFSDEEILQSEGWFDKSNKTNLYHPPSYEDIVSAKRKEKALKELQTSRSSFQTITNCDPSGARWTTWSGSNASQIFDIVNEQHKRNLLQKNLKNQSLNSSPSFLSGARWFRPLKKKRIYCDSPTDSAGSKQSIFQTSELRFLDNIKCLESEQRKASLCEGGTTRYRSDISYMTHTAGTGTKGLGLMHGKMNPMKTSNFVRGNQRQLLDETSLGDFLRALTALHNRVGPRQSFEEFGDRNPIETSAPTTPNHSLIDLFPSQTTLPKFTSKMSLNRTTSMPTAIEEEPKEPSNLKRFGRFLLKSYPTKSESIPDVPSSDEINGEPSVGLKVAFSQPSTQVQISSSDKPAEQDKISRSYTMDSSMRPKRRQSAGILGSRPATSTESVYYSIGRRGLPLPRRTSLNWRSSGRSQSITRTPKMSLDNVKEVNNQ